MAAKNASLSCDQLIMSAPTPIGGETPILLPNELLLQKFSSKSSGYRQSAIRLHQQRQKDQEKLKQERERQKQERRLLEKQLGVDKPKFISTLKKGLKKWTIDTIPDKGGAREMALRSDGPPRRQSDPSPQLQRLPEPTPQPRRQSEPSEHASTNNNGTLRFNLSLLKNLLPSFAPPEVAVSYLTNHTQSGSVWVTTERLIFVPQKPGEKGYYVHIDNLDCMKVVCMAVCDVDYDFWNHPQLTRKPYFFVAYEGTNFLTVPFSTHSRASSFLKLISNIRFEHMVKICLPPPYMSCVNCTSHDPELIENPNSEDDSSSFRSSVSDLERIDSVSTAASSTMSSNPCLCHDDWVHEDNVLPSYQDSEYALRLYLVKRGLIKPEEEFERSSHAQASSILAMANAPPTNEMDALTERERRSYGYSYSTASREEVHYPLVWF